MATNYEDEMEKKKIEIDANRKASDAAIQKLKQELAQQKVAVENLLKEQEILIQKDHQRD